MFKKFALVLALASLGSFAYADDASTIEADANTIGVLDAVAGQLEDFDNVMKNGNQVTRASAQKHLEGTTYSVLVQHCTLRGCIGGALWTLFRAYIPGKGYITSSKIALIKSATVENNPKEKLLPGEKKVDAVGLEILNAVASEREHFKKLLQGRNDITAASKTTSKKDSNIVSIAVSAAHTEIHGPDRFTDHPAHLTITRTYNGTPGKFPPYDYKSKVVEAK